MKAAGTLAAFSFSTPVSGFSLCRHRQPCRERRPCIRDELKLLHLTMRLIFALDPPDWVTLIKAQIELEFHETTARQ